jgi:diacylglycerol kinase family enzyme
MFAYSPAPVMAVELESETITQPSLMVNVMNGRRLGGGFMISPEGDPFDGKMDICIAQDVKLFKMFALIAKFMQGTQYGDPAIQGKMATKVTIRAEQGSLPVHADGETIGTDCDQIQIELLPQQIPLYLPEPDSE